MKLFDKVVVTVFVVLMSTPIVFMLVAAANGAQF